MKQKTPYVECDQPMAFFSLSMSKARFLSSYIAKVCSIDENKILSEELSPDEKNQIDEFVRNLQNLPLWIDDTPALSMDDFKEKARQLVNEHNAQIIYIDDIRHMTMSGMSGFDSDESAAAIKEELITFAKELAVPIYF